MYYFELAGYSLIRAQVTFVPSTEYVMSQLKFIWKIYHPFATRFTFLEIKNGKIIKIFFFFFIKTTDFIFENWLE